MARYVLKINIFSLKLIFIFFTFIFLFFIFLSSDFSNGFELKYLIHAICVMILISIS